MEENFYQQILPAKGKWFYDPKHKRHRTITGWELASERKSHVPPTSAAAEPPKRAELPASRTGA